ncbi:MAG: CBS domain-containing protein, partial [Cyanobacteria bacterium J06639_1]
MRMLSFAVAVPFDRALPGSIAIADAIDPHPLTVAPNLRLTEVTALMSRTWSENGLLCSLDDPKAERRRSSCALVVDGETLIGIFTERDIVRLTAEGQDFQALRVADVMTSPVISMPREALRDIFAVLFFFRRYRIRHLPIVGDRDELVGLITPSRIRQVLRPANLLKMLRVADVMSPEVVQAPPDAPVVQLARMMAAARVSCVVIVEPDREGGSVPVGIVTERDIAQFQVLQIDLTCTPAQLVMS